MSQLTNSESFQLDNLCIDLADAARIADVAKAYLRLSEVFHRTVDYALCRVPMTFSGLFAKVAYLLNEHKAPQDLKSAVDAVRCRLRSVSSRESQLSAKTLAADVAAAARFIRLVFPEYKSRLLDNVIADYHDVDPQRPRRSKHLAEYLRVMVRRWDDVYLYCSLADEADVPEQLPMMTEDGVSVIKVKYGEETSLYKYNWRYLEPLLRPGVQLNVIRPRLDGACLDPELLIYEPDDLVNISTVASCFTNYAESPIVDLLARIKPQQNTEAIMLGNFAGQLLDEVIHQDDKIAYADSVAAFFKANALKLINAGITSQFHPAAKAQKANIEKAMRETLPATVGNFDSKEGIVEPSFFSEMLGLQGRMDFLQSDFKVLIEQKSGKGDFPYGNYVIPKQREEHYVQLLLYMLVIRYNFRTEYERNQKELHAFLLYSKYSESLLKLENAPALVYRALKVRNTLAYAHWQQANDDGCRLLERLTPDRINIKGDTSRLWTDYQQRNFYDLLSPIRQASRLEREYYFRFLTFLSAELYAAKMGANDSPCSGFAATWHNSLDDKRKSGNIYDRLRLQPDILKEDSTIESLTLAFADDVDNDMANFRPGDIVILYPYPKDSQPDMRVRMVHRCSIESVNADSITLKLRHAQSDARAFRAYLGEHWTIEHDFMESAFASLFRGMHAFLSAPKPRRDLLLLQREPKVDTAQRLTGSYGDFDPLMLRVKQASELFIIIGPPGTGKTSFGMLNTLKEELLTPGASVLVMSYTNRAVDEICSKLVAEGIDFVRLGSALGCAPEYRKFLIGSRVEGISTLLDIKRMIVATRVFVGTTTAVNSNSAIFDLRKFSLAIVDEASQIIEPHLIGVLSATYHGAPAIDKVVLIGDHKQLPAVVQQSRAVSVVRERGLNAIGLVDCRLSLFERLLLRYEHNPAVVYMLTRQGRMHGDISEFPNAAFYDGLLTEVGMPHQRASLPLNLSKDRLDIAVRVSRVAFVDVAAPNSQLADKINAAEAEVIADLVERIFTVEGDDKFSVDQTVGVIVPYRNQIAAIRSVLDRKGLGHLRDITIDTVERYQGSQRKYIIYGFTVRKSYQLDFLTSNTFVDGRGNVIDRKLNVAMTRAQEHLILVGDSALLSAVPLFKRLIDYVRSSGAYVSFD